MKVLMISDVYPPLIGGQEREIQMLSEGLTERGNQVVVCTINHSSLSSPSVENKVKVYRIEGIFQKIPHLYSSPERKFHPPMVDLLVSREIGRIIELEKPDIVHANGWMSYSVFSQARRTRIPICVTFHDYGFTCPSRWSPLHYGGVCEKPLSSLAECLTCGKTNFYGPLKSFLSFSLVKMNRVFSCTVLIFTNPNILDRMNYLESEKIYLEHPIDTDTYRPIETEEYADRILIWSKLDRIKGIDTAFAAARQLPEYCFDIIFFGDDKDYYKGTKPPNVTLLPTLKQKEIPLFINKYPLVLGQFVVGAFGHAELEAMSCGKPVVAYWNRKYDSFYMNSCPILSSNKVKEIVRLVRLNVGNRKLGRENRLWTLKYHSVERVAAKLEGIYNNIIDKGYV